MLPKICFSNLLKYFPLQKLQNKVCNLFRVNRKRHWNNLIDMKTLRNIDVALLSLLLTLKRFHSFLQYFILEFEKCCHLGLPAEIKVQTSKNYEKRKPDASYGILTKRVKQQHKKKPVSNLLSMQSVGFEQTYMEFIEIFVLQE